METTQNVVYFQTQLTAASTGLDNAEINLLISDMVKYGQKLEADKNTIPPGENQESKPKPDKLRSTEFRQRIDQLPGTISTELIAIFNDFLTYIQSIETPGTN